MQWYLKALKQYADFGGRARRTEFWMFVLFNVLASAVLGLVDRLIGTASVVDVGGTLVVTPGLLQGIYGLAVLIPAIAVAVRRLHDTDRSGWWALLYVVPLVGQIVLIVFWAIEGTRGANRFGPDPKQDVAVGPAQRSPQQPAA